MRIPNKLVAVEGRLVLVNIGKAVIEINQFEPIDLAESFSDEEIQKSESVKESIKNGWLVEYVDQELPKKPTSKIKIPNMKVGKGPSSVRYNIVEHKNKGKEADVECNVVIPEETKQLIKKAQEARKKQLADEAKELKKNREEELKVDKMIKSGKADIPKVTMIRVDGKKEIPLTKFKAPKSGIKPIKEKIAKINLDTKID
jgi:hypothetical protein